MSDVAIRVENLGKRFRIGSRMPYHRFSELMMGYARRAVSWPGRMLARGGSRPANRSTPETFWALNDVSFDVHEGEVVGIIGRNGAGKSTLLKILSRITEPTTGRFGIRGTIGSLLEVGTGFHPELTGRENIFLSGSILGMQRSVIRRRLDEIVAFAGIERFLDTPVKRFSSGMQVRLGFAVAAHLDAEVLLVDEVLAVGDLSFQRRCLQKMHEVSGDGRTVIFVSHNMGSIKALCSRGLVVSKGSISFDGPAGDAVGAYTKATLDDQPEGNVRVSASAFRTNLRQRITRCEILDESGRPAESVATGETVRFRIHYRLDDPLPNPGFRLVLLSEDRIPLFRVETEPVSGYPLPPLSAGAGHIDCVLPKFPFTAGTYLVDVGMIRPMLGPIHQVENVALLEVQGGDVYSSGRHLDNRFCLFTCDHQWFFDFDQRRPD